MASTSVTAKGIPGVEHRDVSPPLPPPPLRHWKSCKEDIDDDCGRIVQQGPAFRRRDTDSTIGEEDRGGCSSTKRLLSIPPISTSLFQSAADAMKDRLDFRYSNRSTRPFIATSPSVLDPRKKTCLAPSKDSHWVLNSCESLFASSSHSSHLPFIPPLNCHVSRDYERSLRTRISYNKNENETMCCYYDYVTVEKMEVNESCRRTQHDDCYVPSQKRRTDSRSPDDRPCRRNFDDPDILCRCEQSSRVYPPPRLFPSLLVHGQLPASSAAPLQCSSHYVSSNSVFLNSRTTIAQAPPHARVVSGSSPSKVTAAGQVTDSKISKTQGLIMCDCCPKKPRRFETAEELLAHSAERQYKCSYCCNRFKNKNEAERHQNSLHIRHHSWSCSAMLQNDCAFYESTTRPGEADTCGYCGDEFERTGHTAGNSVTRDGIVARNTTKDDLNERKRHLENVHKFRECNTSKKFFRADHFRQHLKHSHAGISGKWTNMLENACLMKEEPLI